MRTVITLNELRSARSGLREPVGLVPTMGFLHEGHLSLVRLARAGCASVVVSIFVNPAQFGPNEDLAAYPRDLERDLDLLQKEGAQLVWMPAPQDMYPPGYQTWIDVEEVTQRLEGSMRPGHFRGVATVVSKLFNAVQPQKAYFGQKDAQQVVEIVVGPTIREADGLAMSSRNAYLSSTERSAAAVLYRALSQAGSAFAAGERDAGNLRSVMTQVINTEPLARLQYVSCADPRNLEELQGAVSQAVCSMAVYIGKTRLIDNLLLDAG
jgi:pantoate--beta-alanine ligase